MNTTFKVLGSIVALGCVMLAIFHFTLLYGLTRMMRGTILPKMKAETGIDARVGRLSINVASGMLFLDDVEIRNPDGFLLENLASVDRIEVVVDIKSLLVRDLIKVKNVEVEGALVNVVRNRAGEINISQIGQPRPSQPPVEPRPSPEPAEPPPERIPEPAEPAPPAERKPLPEILLERLWCKANVRYVDLKLNKIDIALDMDVKAVGISTQTAPDVPWGAIAFKGSLGDDRNSFATDVDVRLAPLVDPAMPSFDLTGSILEIDPRLMQEIYDSLNIRSDPFGLEPEFHCREGMLERSQVALILRNIQLDDNLSDSLGGMGAIESLRFVVPVRGPVGAPSADVKGALKSAIGGNARTLFDAWMKGQAAKQAGMEEEPESLSDAAVEALGREIEEIGENEALKNELKNLGKRLFGN